MYKNRNFIIISIIVLINSIGYGIIIPLLYSYSLRFGLNDFQNGMLFAIFSLCQLLSTPIIGRLSDKYGRKPLLVASLTGTALSFFMTAWAPNAIILFLARALDGITAGNIPVASAVISDSTEPKDRAKGFGIIGASFGFGFIAGPAISALTLQFGVSAPFIVAGVVTTLAVVATALFLPETNKHIGEVAKGKIFDFAKLFHSLFDKNVGMTLLISLIYSTAFGLFIFAFQPFAVKVMHLGETQISLIYTLFGVIGLITQLFIMPRVANKFPDKTILTYALFIVAIAFLGNFFANILVVYLIFSVLLSFSNSFVPPMIQTILSKETDEKSQGTMQGLNASYLSIGYTIGPIVGGGLATLYIPLPFLLAAFLCFVCLYLAYRYLHKSYRKKESAF
jgi:MFS family permease